jgi:hypothetical protein
MRLAALTPKPNPGAKDKAQGKPGRNPFSSADPAFSWAKHTEAGSLGYGSDLHPWASPPGILPKLEVGGAHDPLERQADAVADQVMRMPAPQAQVVERDGGGPTPELEAERVDDVIEAPTEGPSLAGRSHPEAPNGPCASVPAARPRASPAAWILG